MTKSRSRSRTNVAEKPNPAGQTLRLMTWNVAGRVKLLEDQIGAIRDTGCDLIALQELKVKTAAVFRDRLAKLGFSCVIGSFELAQDGTKLVGPRRYGELIASRWPFKATRPDKFEVPWPERF